MQSINSFTLSITQKYEALTPFQKNAVENTCLIGAIAISALAEMAILATCFTYTLPIGACTFLISTCLIVGGEVGASIVFAQAGKAEKSVMNRLLNYYEHKGKIAPNELESNEITFDRRIKTSTSTKALYTSCLLITGIGISILVLGIEILIIGAEAFLSLLAAPLMFTFPLFLLIAIAISIPLLERRALKTKFYKIEDPNASYIKLFNETLEKFESSEISPRIEEDSFCFLASKMFGPALHRLGIICLNKRSPAETLGFKTSNNDPIPEKTPPEKNLTILSKDFNEALKLPVNLSVNNDQMALGFFLMAAQQDHASAKHYVGLCYRDGLGCEKDITLAKKWFKAAFNDGHEDSKVALETLQIIETIEKKEVRNFLTWRSDCHLEIAKEWQKSYYGNFSYLSFNDPQKKLSFYKAFSSISGENQLRVAQILKDPFYSKTSGQKLTQLVSIILNTSTFFEALNTDVINTIFNFYLQLLPEKTFPNRQRITGTEPLNEIAEKKAENLKILEEIWNEQVGNL